LVSRISFFLAVSLMLAIISADYFRAVSFSANDIALMLAAVLTVLAGLYSNAEIAGLFQSSSPTDSPVSGRIRSMVIRVEGAAEGYYSSREEIANVLAESFAVKTRGLIKPDYESRIKAREELKATAAGRLGRGEVLEQRSRTRPSRFSFRRRLDYDYLSELESIIEIVQHGA